MATEEIINRVSKSPIITFDLEALYPAGKRQSLDISQWLYEGILLKEKEFRAALAQHNWTQYSDCYLAIDCSTDTILPAWAFLLVATYAAPYCKKVVIGNLNDLETILYSSILEKLDTTPYVNKPVIIKGCANKPIPANAYILLAQKLQGVAKSLMYGEACSAVPLYKKNNIPYI